MNVRQLWRVTPLVLIFQLIFCNCSYAEPRTGGYFPVLNIKATSPQSLSAELGMSYQLFQSGSSKPDYGPFISYEPGIKGHKVHLGLALTHYPRGIPIVPYWVAKISASYYQAWSESSDNSSGESMYGADITVSYKLFLITAGLYRGQDSHKYTLSYGLGLGW